MTRNEKYIQHVIQLPNVNVTLVITYLSIVTVFECMLFLTGVMHDYIIVMMSVPLPPKHWTNTFFKIMLYFVDHIVNIISRQDLLQDIAGDQSLQVKLSQWEGTSADLPQSLAKLHQSLLTMSNPFTSILHPW